MALLFDSGLEYVNVGTMGSWNPTVYTAWGWLLTTSDSVHRRVYGKDQVGSPYAQHRLRLDSSGTCDFIISGTSSLTYRAASSPFTINQLHFFAVTVNVNAGAGEKVKLYQGTLSQSPVSIALSAIGEGSGLTNMSAFNMNLGSTAGSEDDLNGALWNVGFVRTVLPYRRGGGFL